MQDEQLDQTADLIKKNKVRLDLPNSYQPKVIITVIINIQQ